MTTNSEINMEDINSKDKNSKSTNIKSKTKKPKRCQHVDCRKKLTLTDYTCKCRCGKYFCSLHRLSEQHNCDYNFKSEINYQQNIDEMKCIEKKVENI